MTAAHQLLGQLEAERAQLIWERNLLQDELATLRRNQEAQEHAQVVQHVAGPSDAQAPQKRRWWQFWERP